MTDTVTDCLFVSIVVPSNAHKIFFGYFDPGSFKIKNMNNFRGDLTHNPAIKEALVPSFHDKQTCSWSFALREFVIDAA